MMRRFAFAVLAFLFSALLAQSVSGQDWFRTGTGLGVSKVRFAVPEFAARTQPAGPLEKTFHQVLWDDLNYSGILELVSPSFYPLNAPGQPSELNPSEWSQSPANAYMIAFGNLGTDGTGLQLGGYLYDVHSPGAPPVLEKIYRGPASDDGARKLAHELANDIIARLSGGQPGVATTQIAFVSTRSGNKEIWVMDYDGANQRQFTFLRSIALTPRWSPDDSRIAFTCYAAYRSVVTAQICIYSVDLGRVLAFPRFGGTNSSPAWSPEGTELAFMSSSQGDPEIVVTSADGSHMRRLTLSAGVSTSPVWNPKTGQQIIFVSDRGGSPVLYMMNADGTGVQKINLPDMGYVVDPAWSPNGQLLAFSWRRPDGNYDLYVMDIVSRQLVQLTRDAGRNERPSWAPDGRHLAFESTRTGTRQIWTMLADGSEARQLTSAGQNESPNWSPR